MTITINEFVSREIVYCVSSLISSLTKASSECEIEGTDYDELLSVCVQDDWENPARENGWDKNEDGIFKEDGGDIIKASDWRDACDQDNLDPYTNEAYEHWIVTDWLAKKLEAKGEMVGRDICGLTIWGRCTTGQAISMDGVIQEIYNELVKD